MPKIILRPLTEISPKLEFLVGTIFIKINAEIESKEYKLVRASWSSDYMMLVRKIDKSSNKAEYGVIPSTLKSGKVLVNIDSLKMTLGEELPNWFLKTKNNKKYE